MRGSFVSPHDASVLIVYLLPSTNFLFEDPQIQQYGILQITN